MFENLTKLLRLGSKIEGEMGKNSRRYREARKNGTEKSVNKRSMNTSLALSVFPDTHRNGRDTVPSSTIFLQPKRLPKRGQPSVEREALKRHLLKPMELFPTGSSAAWDTAPYGRNVSQANAQDGKYGSPGAKCLRSSPPCIFSLSTL